eukprot:TRINITY_DN2626_c0_g1_i1.p1 TRINITY_DN2626_c0_g1~~TRINITY_DN2626_c0_g1_i1.p1  ORF type:complete len:1084 (+),score=315.06 TRINITY_DN2626_c0_g1_i1:62-3313(+)
MGEKYNNQKTEENNSKRMLTILAILTFILIMIFAFISSQSYESIILDLNSKQETIEKLYFEEFANFFYLSIDPKIINWDVNYDNKGSYINSQVFYLRQILQNKKVDYNIHINQTIEDKYWLFATDTKLYFNNGTLSNNKCYFQDYSSNTVKNYGMFVNYTTNIIEKISNEFTLYLDHDPRQIFLNNTLTLDIGGVSTNIQCKSRIYSTSFTVFNIFESFLLFDGVSHVSFGRIYSNESYVSIIKNFYPFSNATTDKKLKSIVQMFETVLEWPLETKNFPMYVQIEFLVHKIDCFNVKVGSNAIMAVTAAVPSRSPDPVLIIGRCFIILVHLCACGLFLIIYLKLQQKSTQQITNQTMESFTIQKLNEEKIQLVEALVIAQRFRRRLLTNISHELKTPLNAIIGLTSLILAEKTSELNPEIREKIQHVYSCGNQLTSFLSDMLDLAPGPQLTANNFNDNAEMNELDPASVFKKLFNAYDNQISLITPFYEKLPLDIPSMNSLKILFSLLLEHSLTSFSVTPTIEIELQIIPALRLSSINFFEQQNTNMTGSNSSISYIPSVISHDDQMLYSANSSLHHLSSHGTTSHHLFNPYFFDDAKDSSKSAQKHDILHFIISIKDLSEKDYPLQLPDALLTKDYNNTGLSQTNHGVSNKELKRTLINEVVSSFPGKIWVHENSFHISVTPSTMSSEPSDNIAFSQFESLTLFLGCRVVLFHLPNDIANTLSGMLLRWGFFPYVTEDLDEVYQMVHTESCDLIFLSASLDQEIVTNLLKAFQKGDEGFSSLTNFRTICCGEATKTRRLHDLNEFPLPFVQLPLRSSFIYEKLIVVCQQIRAVEKSRQDLDIDYHIVDTIHSERSVKTTDIDENLEKNLDIIVDESMDDKRTAKLLIADDNALNSAVLKSILNMLGQVDITIVDNGLKAVEICTRYHFDIVFMDIGMPVMDGMVALKKIRNDISSDFQPIYILAITADTENDARDRYSAFDGYCPKPLDLSSFYCFSRSYFEKLGFCLKQPEGQGIVVKKNKLNINSKTYKTDNPNDVSVQITNTTEDNSVKDNSEISLLSVSSDSDDDNLSLVSSMACDSD